MADVFLKRLHQAATFLAVSIMVIATVARAQTRWYDDPGNPHLVNYGRLLQPSVLYDSTSHVFTMWGSDGHRINQALSLDGRQWFYSESSGQDLTADFGLNFLYGTEVVAVDSGYYLYYTATSGSSTDAFVGLATSADGRHWQKHPTVPVIDPPAQSIWPTRIGYPKIIHTSTGFMMAFAGYTSGTNPIGEDGIATSSDGLTWDFGQGTPVITHGQQGAMDANGMGAAGLEAADSTYYLFYNAIDQHGKTSTMGLATSIDGKHWTKSLDNPVMGLGTQGTWNSGLLGGGAVRYARGSFHFWYCAQKTGSSTWLVGYASSDSRDVATAAAQAPARLPERSALLQNYPNPFNPSTRITYTLPRAGKVRLDVYDVLGREVATLVDGNVQAGTHEVQWNAGRAASGVYFYRLQTAGHVETRSLCVLR